MTLDEGFSGQGRVDGPTSGVDLAHHLGQILGRGVFNKESSHTGVHGSPQISRSPEGRHDENSTPRRLVPQLGGDRDPVKTRHLDVEQTHVSVSILHQANHLVTSPARADDLQVVLHAEQGCQSSAYKGLVVG